MFARRCRRSAVRNKAKLGNGASLWAGGDRGASCHARALPLGAIALAMRGVASGQAFSTVRASESEARSGARVAPRSTALVAKTARRLAAAVSAVLPRVADLTFRTVAVTEAFRRGHAFTRSDSAASDGSGFKATRASQGAGRRRTGTSEGDRRLPC